MVELLVRDQNFGMQPSQTVAITVPSERISIREIIRSRVYQAVQDFNSNRKKSFQPSILELELNGPKGLKGLKWQRQFDLAVEAFQRGRLLVLIDDRQTESLDEEVDVIHSKTLVTFLRLIPLVGG